MFASTDVKTDQRAETLQRLNLIIPKKPSNKLLFVGGKSSLGNFMSKKKRVKRDTIKVETKENEIEPEKLETVKIEEKVESEVEPENLETGETVEAEVETKMGETVEAEVETKILEMGEREEKMGSEVVTENETPPPPPPTDDQIIIEQTLQKQRELLRQNIEYRKKIIELESIIQRYQKQEIIDEYSRKFKEEEESNKRIREEKMTREENLKRITDTLITEYSARIDGYTIESIINNIISTTSHNTERSIFREAKNRLDQVLKERRLV